MEQQTDKFKEFVLKYKAGHPSAGAYAAVDHSSGGYPYPTDKFRSAASMIESEARRYTEMFRELEMFEATVIVYLDKK